MSFELPRSPRSLRFTGAVRALGASPESEASDEPATELPEPPKSALGQRRPRPAPASMRPPPPSTRPPPPSIRPKRDVYAAEAQPTPYVGARPSTRAERANLPTMNGAPPSLRAPSPSLSDDDSPTQALERDAVGFPPKTPAPPRTSPNLPVPGFRTAAEVSPAAAPTVVIAPRQPAGAGPLPLPVWLLVALVAGIVSYHYAPAAFTSLERAAGLTDLQESTVNR